MVFEKAASTDIARLVDLRLEYLSDDYGEISKERLSLISNNLPTYFYDHLNKDLIIFVCRDESEIVGCCFLYISEKSSNPSFISGRTGTVLNVYTKPEYRKRGIASKLIQMLLSESAAMKLDFVELKATESGYRLYKSLGFEDVLSKYHNMKYIIDEHNKL